MYTVRPHVTDVIPMAGQEIKQVKAVKKIVCIMRLIKNPLTKFY